MEKTLGGNGVDRRPRAKGSQGRPLLQAYRGEQAVRDPCQAAPAAARAARGACSVRPPRCTSTAKLRTRLPKKVWGEAFGGER